MTDSTMPDASRGAIDSLLVEVAGGSRHAFEALYAQTSSMLFGICQRVLNERGEAEDVLQEVYVAVWNKAAQFAPQQSRAVTWLGTIARNRAIDRLRSLPSRENRVAIDLAERVQDPSPSPGTLADTASTRARLDKCLDQLETRRGVLIRTAFFDGATYEELAARSGSPLGSIKSWIRRGLAQLKACLEA